MTDIPKLIERLRNIVRFHKLLPVQNSEEDATMLEAADALSTAYRQGLQDAAGVCRNYQDWAGNWGQNKNAAAAETAANECADRILALNPTDATEGEKNDNGSSPM